MSKLNTDKTLKQIADIPVQEQIEFLNKVKSLVTGSVEKERNRLQSQADDLKEVLNKINGD